MTLYGWAWDSNTYHAIAIARERRGWWRTTCGIERWVDRWSEVAPQLLFPCTRCAEVILQQQHRQRVEALRKVRRPQRRARQLSTAMHTGLAMGDDLIDRIWELNPDKSRAQVARMLRSGLLKAPA